MLRASVPSFWVHARCSLHGRIAASLARLLWARGQKVSKDGAETVAWWNMVRCWSKKDERKPGEHWSREIKGK